MSFNISGHVLSVVKARLADDQCGLNRWLADLAAEHKQKVWRLDFGLRSFNVLYAPLDVSGLSDKGHLRFDPLVLSCFVPSSENTGRTKHQTFSGQIVVQIDVYHSWTQFPVDAEGPANLIEAALYACLLDEEWEAASDDQSAFPGRMSVTKSALRQGAAANWLQIVTARLQFEVDQQLSR